MSVFEITIQRKVGGDWPVVIRHQPVAGALARWTRGRLELDLEDLDHLWPSDRTYGRRLGKALFREDIRDAFVRAAAEASTADEPLRVLLIVEADDLRGLHWEQLHAPLDRGWDYLLLNQGTPFSLYLPSQIERRFPPIGRLDLRALVLVAGPEELDGDYRLSPFDVTATVGSIQHALGEFPCDLLASVNEAIGGPSLNVLCEHLAARRYTLLHIVCHGAYRKESGETILYFPRDESGRPVQATDLIECLSRLDRLPHFTLLSTCESADPQAETGLGGVAQRMVRELGMPAVLAMTDRISISMAQALASAFYARLGEHGEVDRALAQALAGLQERSGVTIPALFSRLGGRALFSDALDRPLTETEIRHGLKQIQPLLEERAPVLLSEFEAHAAKTTATLGADSIALSREAHHERQAALTAINQICNQALDLSFNALALGQKAPDYDARCPFPGLLAFGARFLASGEREQDDREFFVGRDALIERLKEKLTESNFLAVLGPSGSGKSSLVVAGLVPALQEEEPDLQLTYLTPGSHPLSQLEMSRSKVRGRPTVLIVDQFEELFTLCADEDERHAFLDRLLALAGEIRVVITMRADFWGDCAPYSALRSEMQARQELIAPMETAGLREAMEQQASKVNLRFEADLSNTILDDVKGEPGAMPLLQHALLELWKRRHGRWLLAKEYREGIGGVQQAIAHTADALYKALSPEEQVRVRDIFLRLTHLGEETIRDEQRRDTQQRVRLEELVPVASDPAPTRELVQRLADARLVVTGPWETPIAGQTLDDSRVKVEVGHEALIRHWPRLRGWLDEDRAKLRLRQGVREAALEWEANDRNKGYLIHRSGRLEDVEALTTLPRFALNELEQAYLDACVELREREQRKEEERRHKEAQLVAERRTAGRLRRLALGLGVSVLVALALASLAWFFGRAADAARREADDLKLAFAAQSQLAQNHELALLLAIESRRAGPSLEADTALWSWFARRGRAIQLLSGHTGEVWHAVWSPDGWRIVTASYDGTARVWDAMTGEELVVLHGHKEGLVRAAWDRDGRRIVTASYDGTARVWEAMTGEELAVLTGHMGKVWDAAWSLDGEHVVTAGADGTARVWDAMTGEELVVLSGHGDGVWNAAWSPDGQRIVTASEDGTARLWDVSTALHAARETSVEPVVLRGHEAGVWYAAWSPDGQRIVTASKDGTARLWDGDDGTELIVLRGHTDAVVHAAWDRDGRRIVTASEDGTARVWDTGTGAKLTVLTGHTAEVMYAAWSPDNWRIVTASEDGTARVWDAGTGEELALLPGHERGVWYAAWSPDGRRIVTASNDDTARVWAADSRAELIILSEHKAAVMQAAWDGDGQRIVTASVDGTARVWDARTGEELMIPIGHTSEVLFAAWSPDGRQIITAGCDRRDARTCAEGSARVWDAEKGTQLAILPGHKGEVWHVAWSADGQRIVTAGQDGVARVWNSEGGMGPIVLAGHSGEVVHAAWSSNGRRVVTASQDGTARVWDGVTGLGLVTISGHRDAVAYAAWDRQDQRIVTASEDGTARVWDAETGAELTVLRGHKAGVVHAAWSPDGQRIVTASKDGTARLWDGEKGTETTVLAGHGAGVWSAAWSPDGQRVVTASEDGTARVWDAGTGAELAILAGHSEPVVYAAWDGEGQRVVTASLDGTARIYYVGFEDLATFACEHAVRNLSEEEWRRYMGDEPYRETCPGKPVPGPNF